jgi:hypothetical protein
MVKRTPKPANDEARPKFGAASILAQAPQVVSSLGRPLGFIVIMTALVLPPAAIVLLTMLGRRLLQ